MTQNHDSRKRWISSVLFRTKASKVGLGIILAMLILILVGPLVIPYGPSDVTTTVDSPPTFVHPFGTDFLGHDILSQVVWGAYPSMIVGVLASLGATTIGLVIGVAAGYFRKLESALSGVADVILTFPPLPLMLLLGSLFVATDQLVIGILIVCLWPPISRAIRAQVLSLKAKSYMESAKTTGMTDAEIITKVVIPEVAPIAIAYFVLTVASAIVLVCALQFLGVGNPNIVSWGSILYWAQQFAFYRGDWWWFLAPGLSITLVAVGFALIGFSIEEIMNPRLRT